MNQKTSTLISLGISVALVAAGIWFLYNHPNYLFFGRGNWHMPYHMMTGGGMGIIMMLFWVAIIAALVLLISGLFSNHPSQDSGREASRNASADALEILKRRYASGEIDKTQYDAMKRDLQ